MRISVTPLLAAFAVVLSLYAAPASAASGNYPFCMSRVAGRIGAVEECNYVSMEQCWANAVGLAGSCAPNWRLQYYRQQGDVDAPVIRRRHKKQIQ
ncbi:MAG: DUF3551 domain-containing protein [Rhizobiales bacterium]|nr:DUF3551 domain-containing protein [Hyphomicrobiales bacterium]